MNEQTDDFREWGDAWVYCNQHLRPHKTGWCTVDVRNKVCLCSGEKSGQEAADKCRQWGFELYSPNRFPARSTLGGCR